MAKVVGQRPTQVPQPRQDASLIFGCFITISYLKNISTRIAQYPI
jgi:hypothetical protein